MWPFMDPYLAAYYRSIMLTAAVKNARAQDEPEPEPEREPDCMADVAEPEPEGLSVDSGSVTLKIEGPARLSSLNALVSECRVMGIPADATLNYITVHTETSGYAASAKSQIMLNWQIQRD